MPSRTGFKVDDSHIWATNINNDRRIGVLVALLLGSPVSGAQRRWHLRPRPLRLGGKPGCRTAIPCQSSWPQHAEKISWFAGGDLAQVAKLRSSSVVTTST
jgi:hypothetical protein